MSQTILLVDDSATVRLQARKTLSEAGFDILEAVDGLDALSQLDKSEVHLILCDVNMPRMSGVELVEAISTRDGARPPILMLTTEGHPDLIHRAKAHGAKGWMIKPLKPAVLLAVAHRLLRTAP